MAVKDSPEARFTLFGHPPTPVRIELLPRPLGWRIRRVVLALAVSLLLAPAVFVVPPHVPWALAALAGGIYFARRAWMERFTLEQLEGECPRCGGRIGSAGSERLRQPHTVPCDGCHHVCTLVIGRR